MLRCSQPYNHHRCIAVIPGRPYFAVSRLGDISSIIQRQSMLLDALQAGLIIRCSFEHLVEHAT